MRKTIFAKMVLAMFGSALAVAGLSTAARAAPAQQPCYEAITWCKYNWQGVYDSFGQCVEEESIYWCPPAFASLSGDGLIARQNPLEQDRLG